MQCISSLAKTITLALSSAVLLCAPPMGAWASELNRVTVRESAHDLTVAIRQIKESDEELDDNAPTGSTYTAGTGRSAVGFAPQQVRVRNGEKASLQINQSMPMQWAQKIESQSATLSAAGTTANSHSGGVTQAVTWMESGQSLTVTPRWPGGKQPVKVEIEAQASAVDERNSSDLPATARQRYTTTVSVMLNRWVTIARSGQMARAGSYSSSGTTDGPSLIQIRVSRGN